jgi:hypothetical protein
MKKTKGGLTVWIDVMTPCLIDTETGEEVKTVAYKITNRKELKGYNKNTGWYVNWATIPKECEIYALTAKGDGSIEGLVAVRNDRHIKLLFLYWACAAPHNNKQISGKKKYEGVGGHLFAIAANISKQWGYDGEMQGYAANQELCEHYMRTFKATHIGRLHPYQIFIDAEQANSIIGEYTYDSDQRSV